MTLKQFCYQIGAEIMAGSLRHDSLAGELTPILTDDCNKTLLFVVNFGMCATPAT